MKRIIALNLAEGSLRLRRFLVAGRTFALLSFATMVIFVLAGAATIVRNQSDSSPASTMRGLASAVSSAFFADMLGMEMPAFQSEGSSGSFSGRQVGQLCSADADGCESVQSAQPAGRRHTGHER